MLKTLSADIENDLVDKGIISRGSISFIGQGEGHESYLANNITDRVVVRVKRSDTPFISGFQNEHLQLLFLESQNITFAPKSLYYDSQKEVHVISYVEGVDVSFLELDDTQLKTLVSYITQLETIDYKTYLDFLHKYNNAQPAQAEMQNRIKHNYNNRLAVIEKRQDLLTQEITDFLEWCKENFTIFIAMVNKIQTIKYYMHGDLRLNNGTSNIRVAHDGTVNLIDWEAAGFTNDVFCEIGDMIASVPDIIANIKLLNTMALNYKNTTKLELSSDQMNERLQASLWYATICTPLWMIERYVISYEIDRPRALDYLQKAKQIQANADLYFNFNI